MATKTTTASKTVSKATSVVAKKMKAAGANEASIASAVKKIAATVKAPAKEVQPVKKRTATHASTAKYMSAADRKPLLDKAVAKVFKREGIAGVTRVAVAAEAEVSPSLLRHYFTSAEGLKIAAVQMAVDSGDLRTAKKAVAAGFDVKTLSRKARQALK